MVPDFGLDTFVAVPFNDYNSVLLEVGLLGGLVAAMGTGAELVFLAVDYSWRYL